jgi:hypothetical protein
MAEGKIYDLLSVQEYIKNPQKLPKEESALWFVLSHIRIHVQRNELQVENPEAVNNFLKAIPYEHRFTLIVGLVSQWAKLGAEQALLDSLKHVTGI